MASETIMNLVSNLLEAIDLLKEENKILKERTEKVEQLENIRKEAIKFINEELEENGSHCVSGSDLPYDVIEDLLNILNKGSDKE